MSDRDRLIELLEKHPCISTSGIWSTESISENLADYLLANDVIVPPVKEGDELYRIITLENGNRFISLCPIKVEPYGIYIQNPFGGYSYLSFNDFGKTVFFTKGQAKQALKGGEGDSKVY